jgi:hypothetical protein
MWLDRLDPLPRTSDTDSKRLVPVWAIFGARAMSGFTIDEELAGFLIGGNSVVVATRDAALHPHATRACGLRVTGPDRIVVLLPRATSARAIANIESTGAIAVCVSFPRDFRTCQLKGRCVGIAEATSEDLLISEQQLRAFSQAVAPFGHSRAQARNLWLFESWRVELQVTAAFAQTPGPGAGRRLELGDGA